MICAKMIPSPDRSAWGLVMMGQLNHEQEQLFYRFHLDEVVPDDHLVPEMKQGRKRDEFLIEQPTKAAASRKRSSVKRSARKRK